jgi:hypothetical protein
MLTAVCDPALTAAQRERLDSLLAAPPVSPSASVGTTSQPLDLWWQAARALAELSRGDPGARSDLRGAIAEFGAAHGRQLRLAQMNSYLWSMGRAPADLLDLDLVCLAAITVRSMRWIERPYWSLSEDFADLVPLDRVSIAVGIELGRDDGPDDDDLPHGPRLTSPSPGGAAGFPGEAVRWRGDDAY